ncbi:class I SAM-dependent methyltransferase [Lentzea sp. JNUCC 0626]|uniref:class I SAM-dependent methyltransferase n=1 Tax=Lentzea sp. JNUCC 0626 TaxID=3367513 RepID=UPI003749E562
MTSAEHFDRWYAEMTSSPAADDLVRRTLELPPDLESTSLLSGPGLDEVAAFLALRPGEVLLDLACGRGGYGREVARRASCSVIGVDFSAVAVSQALSRGGDFRVGTLEACGLPDASVDAVMVVDALQFADSKPAVVGECRRVLRPGGRLAVTCWEAVDPADETVPRQFRDLDLARRLPEAGFVDVSVADRPEWRVSERRMWEEALATDAAGDPAMVSMQEEARRVLAVFERRRRVLATASVPETVRPA